VKLFEQGKGEAHSSAGYYTDERVRNLPAIAAIATVSAITTATTAATTSTTIAAAASAITAASAATTTATRAFGLRTGFIHDEVPATEVLTVEAVHRAIGFFIIGNFNEGEPTRLASKTVTNQTDRRRAHTHLREPFLQLFFRGAERKITDVKLLHLRTPSARNLTTIAERTEESNAPRQEMQGYCHGRREDRSVVPGMVAKNGCFCNYKCCVGGHGRVPSPTNGVYANW
jgi:hypothetical protein